MKSFKLIFFLFFSQYSFAQNPLIKQWDYRFGGTDWELINSFQQTRDSGFILGGYSYSTISGDKTQDTIGLSDYWIVKLDSLGNMQWDKDFGGTMYDELYSIQQTFDGGYILGGTSWSDAGGNKTDSLWGILGDTDYWIIKLDSNGTKQWDKSFGGIETDVLFTVKQTTDTGYILGGYSLSNISGNKTQVQWGGGDYWIVKTDSLGSIQWDKDFGGTSTEFFSSLQQTSDGGFILSGWSRSDSTGDKTEYSYGGEDYWIVKTDSAGNKEWDKAFGGTNLDKLSSLKQTSDGGYILGGISFSEISGNKTTSLWAGTYDYWLVKTDSLGNKQWEKDFGGTDTEDDFGNITLTSDGGYLFTGTSYSSISGDKTESNFGPEQIWSIKTDSLGNKQWDKTIFTATHDENGYAIQTNEGCYAFVNYNGASIGGYKTQPSQGGFDYWIVKFCDTTKCYATIPSITQIGDTLFVNTDYVSYQWYYSGNLISGATDYTYVANLSGNYNIIVADSNGCTAGAGIINVIASSESADKNSGQFIIIPNPAHEKLFITTNTKENYQLKIIDAVGKIIYTQSEIRNPKSEINISSFANGIYIISLTTQKENLTARFIIQ